MLCMCFQSHSRGGVFLGAAHCWSAVCCVSPLKSLERQAVLVFFLATSTRNTFLFTHLDGVSVVENSHQAW